MRALLFLALLPELAHAQGYLPASMHPSSISTSEPTWTSTQTDGGAAFVAPEGSKVCHTTDCSVYTTYDGGTLGLVGAEVEAPQGFKLSTTDVQAATLAQPMSFNNLLLTEAAPTGSALMLVGGARFWWTTPAINGNAHCEWDNNIGISCASALQIGAGASFFADSIYSRQGDRSVSIDQAQGLRFAPQSSIGTCDNTTGSGHSREGDVKLLSGAVLSARSRLCLCTSDGGGTPAYAWLNVVTGTVGTSSACNN
jgi:hypothetical protein